MRRTTVEIQLRPHGFFTSDSLKVDGYELDLGGIDLVVHRSLALFRSKRSKDREPHPPRLSKTYWSVTEPRTGAAICEGSRQKTRSIADAIQAAELKIAEEGGPDAVEAAVARHLCSSPEAAA